MDAPLCRLCGGRHWGKTCAQAKPAAKASSRAAGVTPAVTPAQAIVTKPVPQGVAGALAVTPSVTLESLAAEVAALCARLDALERGRPPAKTAAERMREYRARKTA